MLELCHCTSGAEHLHMSATKPQMLSVLSLSQPAICHVIVQLMLHAAAVPVPAAGVIRDELLWHALRNVPCALSQAG